MTSPFSVRDDTEDARQLVDRAKGALMLQFGIGSHEAFAMLLRWSRQHELPVPDIARVLVLGVVEEDPTTLATDVDLVRWLEEQLTGEAARGRHSRS